MAQENGYIVEVSDNGTTGWTQLADLPAGTTSYQHTGLAAGATKYYRGKAKGNGTTTSDSPYTSVVSATTEAAQGTALAAPTATAQPSTSVPNALRLNWSDVANNSGYQVQYSTDSATWQEAGTVGANVITFLVEGLQADALYYVRVRALGTGSYTSSPYSLAVSAKTDLFLEPFDTLNTSVYTVTNVDPSRVKIEVRDGVLFLENLGGGTTTITNNKVEKTNGFSGFPLHFEFKVRVKVGTETGGAWQVVGLYGDSGNYLILQRGGGSAVAQLGLALSVGGTVLHNANYTTGTVGWANMTHARFVLAADGSVQCFASKDSRATWEQVGPTLSGTLVGALRPTWMMQGATGALKQLETDYYRVYKP